MSYPIERKEAVLKKMLAPMNRSIHALSKEKGIAEGTLYNWRKQARLSGRLMPDSDQTPEGWNATDKFAAMLKSASMNEAGLSRYCRKRGLYPDRGGFRIVNSFHWTNNYSKSSPQWHEVNWFFFNILKKPPRLVDSSFNTHQLIRN